jgi:hypothetical protein
MLFGIDGCLGKKRNEVQSSVVLVRIPCFVSRLLFIGDFQTVKALIPRYSNEKATSPRPS